MPVKYWTFAGLLLTYWCNARCASCCLCGAPSAGGDMSVEDALAIWAGLQSASIHGCRIHIGGGEPFGRWPTLIELARRARRQHLGPLEAVETNAFWASDSRTVRDRLAALDEAGMGRLTISADPYHQQFVPMERVRLAARLGREILGPDRVRVRWRDWLAEGFDTDRLTPAERRSAFAAYAQKGRDRPTGRAADELAGLLPLRPAEEYADSACKERLLRSRHVHVDGEGIIFPGTCAGIILGRTRGESSIPKIWQALTARFADISQVTCGRSGRREEAEEIPNAGAGRLGLDVVRTLARLGPVALMAAAERCGYRPRPGGYAGKCHLCWDVRRWLFENGHLVEQLGPQWVYRA